MFDRFTGDARLLIRLARDEAEMLGHDIISPAHFLLGSVGTPAGELLVDDFGVPLETLRADVAEFHKDRPAAPDDSSSRQTPLTADAKQVLEFALREALQLGHRAISSDHILLAIMRVESVPDLLLATHVDLDSFRAAISHHASTGERPGQQQQRGAGDGEPPPAHAAVLALWDLLPAHEVQMLNEERPDVVEFCRNLHEKYDHAAEQR